MSESDVLKRAMLALSAAGARVFRQNTGLGWIGQTKRVSRSEMVKMEPGDVLIKNARPLHAGLCKGSSDIIGWTSIEINPSMVGKKVAIFTAVEAKDEIGGSLTEEQARFIDVVEQAGGIAGVARSGEEAVELLSHAYKTGPAVMMNAIMCLAQLAYERGRAQGGLERNDWPFENTREHAELLRILNR